MRSIFLISGVSVLILSGCGLIVPQRENTGSTSSGSIYTGNTLSGDIYETPSTTNLSGSTGSGSGGIFSGSTQTGSGVSEKPPSSASPYCFASVCIDTKHPYFQDGTALVQISGTRVGTDTTEYLTKNPGKVLKNENSEGENYNEYTTPYESSRTVIIDRSKEKANIRNGEVMGGSSETVFAAGKNLIVKITQAMGCSSSYKEEFFDIAGRRIVDPTSLLPVYPKDIQIGNMHLISDWTRAKEDNMYGFKFSGREDPADLGEVSLSGNYREKIKDKIVQSSGNGAYTTYVIRFLEIPGVMFYYTNTLGSSEAIIAMDFSPDDLDEKGNVITEGKTREILKLYGGKNGEERKIWRSIRLKGREDDYTGISEENFLPEMLPIFRVQKLENTTYLMYPAEKYEGFTSAELCKPLVYIYDRMQRDNSLEVQFPNGGNFTKILPAFSIGQSWDFVSDRMGVITVKDIPASFGYLYYSAKVGNYQYNKDGWQIYGRDVEKFFDEKLDTIGFNPKEKKDFIEYWIHEFDPNTLYFVSFKFDEAIDPYVTLNFSKKPDRQIRVLLESYPLSDENPEYLWPKIGTKFDSILLKTFIRSGNFDVLEWGGTVQKTKNGAIIIH